MKLIDSLKTYSYSKCDESYVLNINGYDFFYCNIKHHFKIKEALAVILNKHIDKASFKHLKANFSEGILLTDNIAFKDDMLIIIFKENNLLIDKLNKLTSLLSELYFKDKDTCFICAGKANKKSYNGLYLAYHDSCLEKYKNQDHDDHILKGFIYSMIGSFIAIFIIALIYIFTNSYFALLNFTIPVLSSIFFYLSKAKRSIKSDLFIYIFSFITCAIFTIIYIALDIKKCANATDLLSYILNYKDHFILTIFQSFVYYALGIIPSLLFLKNQNIEKASKIK